MWSTKGAAGEGNIDEGSKCGNSEIEERIPETLNPRPLNRKPLCLIYVQRFRHEAVSSMHSKLQARSNPGDRRAKVILGVAFNNPQIYS